MLALNAKTRALMLLLSVGMDEILSYVPAPDLVDMADDVIGRDDIDAPETLARLTEWAQKFVEKLQEPDESDPEKIEIDLAGVCWEEIGRWLRLVVKLKRTLPGFYTHLQRRVAEGFMPPFQEGENNV